VLDRAPPDFDTLEPMIQSLQEDNARLQAKIETLQDRLIEYEQQVNVLLLSE
jgi:uncharacterized protein YlxW (UPF0749 family)